jgi:mono/diheme cytochrome c family protein
MGGWSATDIVAYLSSGWNSRSVASGPMAEVVENSTSQMTDADRSAIAVFLKDMTASSSAPVSALAPSDPAMVSGAKLYQINCVGCHGSDGRGETRIFPPLAGNSGLLQSSPENLVRVVLEGAQAVSTKTAPTAPSMPSFAWKFDDAEIADILTYVRNSWGNAAPPVAAESVAKARSTLRGGS